MKFIWAFVSVFDFALRKKAWKEGKWVDTVCQHEAPARVNVFATYSYDYSVSFYPCIYHSTTRCNRPVQQWISLTSSRYEYIEEFHCWHSHVWNRIVSCNFNKTISLVFVTNFQRYEKEKRGERERERERERYSESLINLL